MTIRSTTVEQKRFSPSTQAVNWGSSPHRLAYSFTQRHSSSPLCSLSSQARITKPGRPSLQRVWRKRVSLPGKLDGGASSALQAGSKTMPASVVLEMIKRRSGFWAQSRTDCQSPLGSRHRETQEIIRR